MATNGWPTVEDVATYLNVDPTDPNLFNALESAKADAIRVTAWDPTEGARNAGEWWALVQLAGTDYQDRNRSPDWALQGATALNSPTRNRALQRLARTVPVA